MKRLLLTILLSIFCVTTYAQSDTAKPTKKISAEESKDDKGTSLSKTPIKLTPNKNDNTVNGLTVPETNMPFNKPEQEFSMFDTKKFANPGELYEKRIQRQEQHLKDISEEAFSAKEVYPDQNLGKYRTKTVEVNLMFRDYGEEDGDFIRIFVNGELIAPRIMLYNRYKGQKVPLEKGANKIEFVAINEGFVRPNTAELKVLDDSGGVIVSKIWALSSGNKATITFVKQ